MQDESTLAMCQFAKRFAYVYSVELLLRQPPVSRFTSMPGSFDNKVGCCKQDYVVLDRDELPVREAGD